MSDIVERLREFGKYPYRHENKMALEAADLIERQAKEIAMLKEDEQYATELAEKYLAQSNEAQTGIERLRGALKQIAGPERDGYIYHGNVYQQIARAALNEHQGPQSDDPAKT